MGKSIGKSRSASPHVPENFMWNKNGEWYRSIHCA